jgi:hypothetical protein
MNASFNTSSRDRISVDLQGLKAAVLARAHELKVSPSDWIRSAVRQALAMPGPGSSPGQGSSTDEHLAITPVVSRSMGARVRVSLRMDAEHAVLLTLAAKRSGLSLGAQVAGMLDEVPILLARGDRSQSLGALTASNAEMATLSRDLRQLTNLLRRGEGVAARTYRDRLDRVQTDVQAHLGLAARVVADLSPRRVATRQERPGRTRRTGEPS